MRIRAIQRPKSGLETTRQLARIAVELTLLCHIERSYCHALQHAPVLASRASLGAFPS